MNWWVCINELVGLRGRRCFRSGLNSRVQALAASHGRAAAASPALGRGTRGPFLYSVGSRLRTDSAFLLWRNRGGSSEPSSLCRGCPGALLRRDPALQARRHQRVKRGGCSAEEKPLPLLLPCGGWGGCGCCLRAGCAASSPVCVGAFARGGERPRAVHSPP